MTSLLHLSLTAPNFKKTVLQDVPRCLCSLPDAWLAVQTELQPWMNPCRLAQTTLSANRASKCLSLTFHTPEQSVSPQDISEVSCPCGNKNVPTTWVPTAQKYTLGGIVTLLTEFHSVNKAAREFIPSLT